ncbi:MAG: riboflavin synthase [Thermodesulfovibrionales bacterium]|nr:riboflavin synthase [Thermodesulfovibrionales bacterium]
MFTGLVAEMGTVVSLRRKGAAAVLSVSAPLVGVKIGDSISVSGACLTVTSSDSGILHFDLSDETLRSTNLVELKAGGRVNLEPSLRADGRLGGHFVTGHVDAVGSIRKKTKEGGMLKFEISAPPHVMELLVPKGSVALDGISLTVVDVLEDGFTIVIIPHTAVVTTIGSKSPGDGVNIETDIIGKYVYRILGRGEYKGVHGGSGLMGKLKEEGFL